MITYTEIWNNCLSLLRKRIDEETFKTWFTPIVPVKIEDGKFFIEVPSSFFYEWISEHYSKDISLSLSEVCGFNINVDYLIKEEKNDVNNGNIKNINKLKLGKLSPYIDFIKKNFNDTENLSGLNPKYTFENFIEGESNQLARSSAESVAKKPYNNPFNPLMIYGEVGLGKTHLLHAIGNKVKEIFDDKIVIYIQSTVFIDQYINSIRNNTSQDFSGFYSNIDVLLLDDVQFLKDKIKTQENLFYIFNQLHQIGKQIVLTSDRPPSELEGLQDRLVSRFKWGLMADISVPDLETKIAILKSKFDYSNNIPNYILEYIAQRVNSNIRELEGVMITAIANVSWERNLDTNQIQKIINRILNNDIEVDRISNVVAEYFKISIEDILGKSRQKDITLARHVAMYFAKQYTECSLNTIGSLMGGRDHSTVTHAINNVENLLKTKDEMKKIIESINKEINNKLRKIE